MLRSQFLSEVLASGIFFAFGGGRDFGGIGVHQRSIFGLLLPVFLFSLARDKFRHYIEAINIATKKLQVKNVESLVDTGRKEKIRTSARR